MVPIKLLTRGPSTYAQERIDTVGLQVKKNKLRATSNHNDTREKKILSGLVQKNGGEPPRKLKTNFDFGGAGWTQTAIYGL